MNPASSATQPAGNASCISPDVSASNAPRIPARPALIKVRNLCKRYATADGAVVRAADNVNLDIAAGDSVALVGASGSGKSTLLHLIGAMDEPDSGTIHVGGTSVTDLKGNKRAAYRAQIGFIFQSFRLIDVLTVAQNVSAPLVGRVPKAAHREKVMAELAAVGLAERANSYPSQLSGGQQQRVAIARALAVDPMLILADEPTGNLDSENSAKIIELLLKIQEERHTTLVVATHDPSLARLMQRVIRIKDGVATEQDAPSQESEDKNAEARVRAEHATLAVAASPGKPTPPPAAKDAGKC